MGTSGSFAPGGPTRCVGGSVREITRDFRKTFLIVPGSSIWTPNLRLPSPFEVFPKGILPFSIRTDEEIFIIR